MSLYIASFVILGAMIGGFVNGLAGFGTALFALGIWLQVLSPMEAVAAVLVVSVTTGLQGLYVIRKSIPIRRLSWFLIPAIIGVPLGVQLLERTDPIVLRLLIAGLMILYAVFFLARKDLPALEMKTPFLDSLIGFIGGFMGAFSGISGALPTMWIALRDLPKEETRGVLQTFNVAVLGLSAGALWFQGAYTGTAISITLIAVPAAILAAQFGIWTFKRQSNAGFRRLIVILMGVSGSLLLLREGIGLLQL